MYRRLMISVMSYSVRVGRRPPDQDRANDKQLEWKQSAGNFWFTTVSLSTTKIILFYEAFQYYNVLYRMLTGSIQCVTQIINCV